ncbi:MAG: DUF1488 domain-containing protein [Shewanella sp.]|nr:DUF1488 domain-containing protein [Shewanella sp.]
MNQSIIFTDDIQWDQQKQSVYLFAQCQGVIIPCFISLEKLAEFSEQKIISEKQALTVAEQFRFDLEDYFEEQIESEAMDDSGTVYYQ